MNSWNKLRRDAILLEDETALVLNKPAGLSVMGERHGTDLVDLAEQAGEPIFPVHRIDKATSGAILLAKELRFHGELTRQFNRRTVGKAYLAVTRSTGLPEQGTIELPLAVGRKNRVRIAADRADIVVDERAARWSVDPAAEPRGGKAYPSVTTFARVWGDERNTLLAVSPVTGRRHQIRVHLAWIGHPILGDPLFDRASAPDAARTLLHSWRLSFDSAAAGGDRVSVIAPPGPDFWEPVRGRLPEDVTDGLERAYRLAAERAARLAGEAAVAVRHSTRKPGRTRPRPVGGG